MHQVNTTFDLYFNNNAPPNDPDVERAQGGFVSYWWLGHQINQAAASQFLWDSLMDIPNINNTQVQDNWIPANLTETPDTLYIPDYNGQPYKIIFVELHRYTPNGIFYRMYLQRMGAEHQATLEDEGLIEISGFSTDYHVTMYSTSGSLILSGSSSEEDTSDYTSTGEIVVSGSSTDYHVTCYTTSGELDVQGSSTVTTQSGSITRVSYNESESTTNTSKTSIAVGFSPATTAGNLVVLTIAFNANPGTITPPATGSWVLANSYTSGPYVYQYYAKNCPSLSGSYTWSWTNGVILITYAYNEVSGCSATSPLDQTQSKNSTGTSLTSQSLTPSTSREIIIGNWAGTYGNNSTTLISGWSGPGIEDSPIPQATQSNVSPHQNLILIPTHYLTTSTSAWAPTITSSDSLVWAYLASSFK